jgi:ribosomal protein L24E
MRVAGIVGSVVLVCREKEFEAAEKEGREPRSVGFKKEWIRETLGQNL